MKLTNDRIEEVITETHSWSDEKVMKMSERFLDLTEHAIKTNTPNLVSESDAIEMRMLVDAFRVQLHQDSFDRNSMNEVDGAGVIEEDVTSEDKDALLEFADKLKNKAENMEVTSTLNPLTQEEAPITSATASDTTLEDTQASAPTSKSKKSTFSSKKAGK